MRPSFEIRSRYKISNILLNKEYSKIIFKDNYLVNDLFMIEQDRNYLF